MLRTKNLLATAVLMGSAAHAGLLDTDYSSWPVVRSAPTAFANIGNHNGRSNVLEITVDPTRPTSGHYRFQSHGNTLASPLLNSYSVLYASAYIPQDWLSTTGAATHRDIEMWTAIESSDPTCTQYCEQWPAVYFDNTRYGGGQWYAWSSTTGVESVPVAAIPDQWNLVCQVLSETALQTYVNGSPIFSQNIDVYGAPGMALDRLKGVVINAWNFGTEYDAHWSNIGAGTLTAVAATGGSGQSAALNTAFTNELVVQATDANGSPLPCVPITFTAPDSGASATLSLATVVTDINGEARITAAANGEMGSYAVTASAPVMGPVMLNLTNGVTGPGTSTPTPVPTLDLFSLFGLSGLVAAMGVWLRRRRA